MSFVVCSRLSNIIYFGDIDEMNRLLDIDTRITIKDLSNAIAIGNLDIINTLLNRGAMFGYTHFREACLRGNLEVIKILLKDGINLNSTCSNGETMLINIIKVAKEHPTSISVVKLLWSSGININISNLENKTALSIAKELNLLEHVNLLQSYTEKMIVLRLMNLETNNILHRMSFDVAKICASYL